MHLPCVVGASPAFVCTSTSLTLLLPVRSMSDTDQALVTPWLLAHRLDPDRLAPRSVIRCEREDRELHWWEVRSGRPLVAHVRHRPATGDESVWPRPFPAHFLARGADAASR